MIQKDELNGYIKEYIKDNLSIFVDAYEGNSSWPNYTNIKVNVSLELEGEQISYNDISFNIDKS